MNFGLSEEQQVIQEAVKAFCSGFDDAYWLTRDREGGFPIEFYDLITHKAQPSSGTGMASAVFGRLP